VERKSKEKLMPTSLDMKQVGGEIERTKLSVKKWQKENENCRN
jgi:hypothetical protein